MEQKILAELKEQLETRQKQIIKDLSGIGHRAEGAEVNFDTNFPEYGDSLEDSASEVADYATNLSVEKKLESELRDVEAALHRVEHGTYGVCHFCGQLIEVERLKARPESSSCVACKKAAKGIK